MSGLATGWLRAVSDPGIIGKLTRGALTPLSWLYGAGVMGYRAAYRLGLRPTFEPALPTTSVGALAVGGAGKTTVAAFLAQALFDEGCRPAIVLRGYGRRRADDRPLVVSAGRGRVCDVEACGDEAAMLAELCPGAVVVVDRRRERAIDAAAAQGAQLAILDDGFEYFRLRRDIDILVLNLLQFGPAMRLLPAGILRDPPALLRLAHQVWFTYARAVDQETIERAVAWVRRFAPNAKTVLTHHRIVELAHVGGRRPSGGELTEAIAFCGIGSPEGFRRALEEFGLRVVELQAFPDHHWYNTQDVERIVRAAEGAGGAVTTRKDFLRLDASLWPDDGPPLAVAELRLDIIDSGQAAAALKEALSLCQKP